MMHAHRLSIRSRLILLVLAVVLPAAGLVAWLIHAESGRAREAAYVRVNTIARHTADDLTDFIHDHEVVLGRFAERPLVRALDAKNCDPLIAEYVHLYPEFTTLALRDAGGKLVCSFLPDVTPQLQLDRFPWFEESVRNDRFTVSNLTRGHKTGRWVTVLTQPVRDRAGALAGLLIQPLDLLQLQHRVLVEASENALLAVVDRNDKLLLRTADGAAAIGTSAVEGLGEMHGQAGGLRTARGPDGVLRLYASAAVAGTGWSVYAGLPEGEVYAGYRAWLVRSVFAGVAILLLVLMLTHHLSTIIVEPIRALVRTCAQVENGDTTARAAPVGPPEIESVARQFNRMLDVRWSAEEALRASEERLHGIVHMAVEAIVVFDEQCNIVLFNPAAESIFGCSAAAAMGSCIDRFIPPRLHEFYHQHLAALSSSGPTAVKMRAPAEAFGQRADGAEFALEFSVSRITHSGRPLYSAVFNDISARKRDEARLTELANYDALTALPNRMLFHQRLRRSLVHAQRFDEGLAVLFIDLDRFKNVNDSLGHEAGDHVLQAVAQRLKGCLREVDTLARLGGDEFAVLIEQVTDARMVGGVARKLLKAVAEQLLLDQQEYQITASIGISTYPADGDDDTTLLKNADIAMYRAKDQGKNNSQFYAAAMNAHSRERLALETGMRHALERGEFLLHYQPKVDIASGRITGMEALVRWMRPGLGMVPPAEFIPLAEESGLIVPIGAWVLKAACERVRAWQQMGAPLLRVAVNLSARQFAQSNLVSDVARILDASGLAPASLELEITESMVMNNPERAIQTLRQLKLMGISLAIDDFGTGYSSLGYLKRFPIDNIKIDRSFIKDIPGNSDDAIITRTIIDMTHNLRLKAIAEGVETEAQFDLLREVGCDQVQGFLISHPVLADDVPPMLARLTEARRNPAPAAYALS